MPTSSDYRWIAIAEKFPPTLVTNAPPAELGPDMTPAAYGLDMVTPGYLRAGSLPATTARLVQTYTVAAKSYEWHFRRLWRLSDADDADLTVGKTLIFGALDYTSVYFPQERGQIDLPEATTIKVLPVGSSLALMGANGTFLLSNANEPSANFRQVDVIQEAFISNAANAVELDGVLYFSNSKGLFSMTETGNITELSVLLRGNALVQNKALTCDYSRGYVVLAADAAYDVQAKKFFDYSTAGFYYQSPMIRQPNGEPFAIRALAFDIEHGDTNNKTMTIGYRFGGRDWNNDVLIDLQYGREERDRKFVQLESVESARTFDFKITNLPTTLYIRRIYAEVSGFTQRSRED